MSRPSREFESERNHPRRSRKRERRNHWPRVTLVAREQNLQRVNPPISVSFRDQMCQNRLSGKRSIESAGVLLHPRGLQMYGRCRSDKIVRESSDCVSGHFLAEGWLTKPA